MLYFNGKFLSADLVTIDPTDRGFLLGDGVFETWRAYQGKMIGLQAHWERLKRGAEVLHIPLELSFSDLLTISKKLLEHNHLLQTDACLRFTLSRGVGPRGLLPPKVVQPSMMLTASPLTNFSFPPARVKTVSIRRNEFSPLAGIKSLSYLENILAKMEAVDASFTEAILLNTQNFIAEASCANFFMLNAENSLLTPRIEDGALPGITRLKIIELAKSMRIEVKETSISVEQVYQAKELFLTNSLIEILPIEQFNHCQFETSAFQLTTILRSKFTEYITTKAIRDI